MKLKAKQHDAEMLKKKKSSKKEKGNTINVKNVEKVLANVEELSEIFLTLNYARRRVIRSSMQIEAAKGN